MVAHFRSISRRFPESSDVHLQTWGPVRFFGLVTQGSHSMEEYFVPIPPRARPDTFRLLPGCIGHGGHFEFESIVGQQSDGLIFLATASYPAVTWFNLVRYLLFQRSVWAAE